MTLWKTSCTSCATQLRSAPGTVAETHEVKALGQPLDTTRSAQFEWDQRGRADTGHWLGGQTKTDRQCRFASADSAPNMGRAPARRELLISEVEVRRHHQSPPKADPETAST